MKNILSYLNHLLYPILFEENSVKKAAQISNWIKESRMGYNLKQKQNFLEAVDYFLKDDSVLSKTIAPDYDVEKFKKYLIEIKESLLGGN